MLTPEQREARRHGIGGSDAAAICGRHPSKGPADVWRAKVYGDDDVGESERVAWGNRLEPIVRDAVAEEIGQRIRVPADTFRHRDHDWMLAHLDGECEDGAIYEGKCLDRLQIGRLGPRGEEQPLVEHWYQVQHYMEVLDRDLSRIGYLIGGNELRVFEVPRDPEIGALLVEVEGEFWHRYVLAREVPPDEPSRVAKALAKRYPAHAGDLIPTDSPEVRALAEKAARARLAVKQAKAERDAIDNELRALIGSDAGFDFGDAGKVTWRAHTKSSVDVKALRAAHPAIAAAFTRKTPTRTLRVALRGFDAGDDE